MPQAPIIFHERAGAWAVALRRHLGDTAGRLIETRSWEECWRRLAENPLALGVWELTYSNIRPLVGTLLRLQREFPATAAVVVTDRRLAACETLVREAGAVHFVDSPRKVVEIIEVVRRRASRPLQSASGLQNSADDNEDLLTTIWSNLPWSDTV